MCLSNFKAIRQFKVPISWLRDFTRSYEKTSFRILRRGPGSYVSHCLWELLCNERLLLKWPHLSGISANNLYLCIMLFCFNTLWGKKTLFTQMDCLLLMNRHKATDNVTYSDDIHLHTINQTLNSYPTYYSGCFREVFLNNNS